MKNLAIKIAVFPGSFDPFTIGHLDIVLQTLKVFDRIVIGIGLSPTKNPMFDPKERVSMISKLWSSQPQVSVECFDGLAVNFAKKKNSQFIVRGVRTEADFSYEMPMAITNKKIGDVLTLFFPTNADHTYISSSLVRELARHGGDISPFLPSEILSLVKKKIADCP